MKSPGREVPPERWEGPEAQRTVGVFQEREGPGGEWAQQF